MKVKPDLLKKFVNNVLILSSIIIIHELGHFLWCKAFGVTTQVFSIGFGPALISTTWWSTKFQLSLLPLGGYVSMNFLQIEHLYYVKKLIILSAGVIHNFLLACIISIGMAKGLKKGIEHFITLFKHVFFSFLGVEKIPIMKNFHDDATLSSKMQRMNIEIGLFNLIPIYILDGGKIVDATLQAVLSLLHINQPSYIHIAHMLFWVVLILILHAVRARHVQQLNTP